MEGFGGDLDGYRHEEEKISFKRKSQPRERNKPVDMEDFTDRFDYIPLSLVNEHPDDVGNEDYRLKQHMEDADQDWDYDQKHLIGMSWAEWAWVFRSVLKAFMARKGVPWERTREW